jgi:hypothetical protein
MTNLTWKPDHQILSAHINDLFSTRLADIVLRDIITNKAHSRQKVNTKKVLIEIQLKFRSDL